MSAGTLIAGPLSDSFGRKTVIYWGAGLYILASIICIFASNLETMIIARLCQGFGAAAPRVVSQALIRDLYSGRQMARISSFVMIIFSIVPALAPLLGAGLISIFAWQSIFVIFIVFSALSTTWTGFRIQEPLAPEQRIPFRRKAFQTALVEIFSLGMVRMSMLTMVFAYAMLFLSILMVQQIFDQFYNRADSFPRWFALVAGLSASASFLNSMIVMRLGMRRLISAALRIQIVWSLGMLLLYAQGLMAGDLGFALFIFWIFGLFFQAGMTLGNLTALAMEPLGHIAGTAASVTSAVATLGSILLASVAGQFFDGTPLILIVAIFVLSICGSLSAHRLKRFERRAAV
jgi:DHA1 family bicyclomycin/chloramphenicol resistance-like MFS transporter